METKDNETKTRDIFKKVQHAFVISNLLFTLQDREILDSEEMNPEMVRVALLMINRELEDVIKLINEPYYYRFNLNHF